MKIFVFFMEIMIFIYLMIIIYTTKSHSIWNESFFNIDFNIIKTKLDDFNHRKEKQIILKNKDIEMKFRDETFIIKDYEQNSFISLLDYLYSKHSYLSITDFDLLHFIKIQYFNQYINKKILNSKWKNFIYEVFESETISNLISNVYKYGKNISKKEFRKIIDSSTYCNFNTSFFGKTYLNCKFFVSGLIEKNNINDDNNINKEIIKYNLHIFFSYVNQRLYESGEYMQCNYLENY